MQGNLDKEGADALRKKIARKTAPAWDRLTEARRKEAFAFAEGYRKFLDAGKTEREAVAAILDAAVKAGFEDLDAPSAASGKYYRVHRDKMIALSVVGKTPMNRGFSLVGAHIDSPRLDLKQNPLYEELDLAMCKTHYYGGIRKYHWLARPLALHGVVIKGDGSRVNITVGESESDPVFTVSDLLPHLATKLQGDKKLSVVFEGEKLNLIFGSLPAGDEEIKERFKLNILALLFDRYGIVEEDLVSAEIEAVPAGKARDVGLDRSLVGAYGQDDRICAYTAMEAIVALGSPPEKTAVAMFFDKEEVGSEGDTGAKSVFLESFIGDLIEKTGGDRVKELSSALIRAKALSADVNAALEPDYQSVYEKLNAARIGYGVCMTKFTGVRGKAGSNDASAEFTGAVRKIFNSLDIVWQTGELGRIDEGGGGTIAKFLSNRGMETLDCGPGLLSMHSPFEISSKADLFMTYLAYKAFYENI